MMAAGVVRMLARSCEASGTAGRRGDHVRSRVTAAVARLATPPRCASNAKGTGGWR